MKESLVKIAVKQMLKDGEFPKIIKNAKGQDKVKAKEFYDAIKDVDIDKLPILVIIGAIRSVSVYGDLICYMETYFKKGGLVENGLPNNSSSK